MQAWIARAARVDRPHRNGGGPPPETRLDELARKALGRPLTVALAGLIVFQLIQWVPQYLTWPLFADHDVFLTAAQAWDAGEKPYRDFLTNNFPGTIYVCWALGKLGGWGNAPLLYAADVAFLLAFGAMAVAWSGRRLGGTAAGLVVFAIWLSYYLDLDYSLTAQRDWHAGGLSVMALMAVQAWPNRRGRLASVILLAMAASVRPQVVLFVPAWWIALRGDGEDRRVVERLGWVALLGLATAATLAPLAWQGLLGDFLGRLRLVAYGGEYSKTSLGTVRVELVRELMEFAYLAMAGGVALLVWTRGRVDRRLCGAWLAAFGAALIYKPMSPVPHAYLIQPLTLICSVLGGLLFYLARSWPGSTPVTQALVLLLLIGFQVNGRPRFCNFETALAAPRALASGVEPAREPMGFEFSPWAKRGAGYKWADYRALLDYLRTQTSPDTRIANVLRGYPPLTSAVGRLSALPAESIAWCLMIRGDDEAEFARALEAQTDSVVVWAPEEVGRRSKFDLDVLAPTIRRLYEPAEAFGPIEVWTRRADRPPTDPVPGEIAGNACPVE